MIRQELQEIFAFADASFPPARPAAEVTRQHLVNALLGTRRLIFTGRVCTCGHTGGAGLGSWVYCVRAGGRSRGASVPTAASLFGRSRGAGVPAAASPLLRFLAAQMCSRQMMFLMVALARLVFALSNVIQVSLLVLRPPVLRGAFYYWFRCLQNGYRCYGLVLLLVSLLEIRLPVLWDPFYCSRCLQYGCRYFGTHSTGPTACNTAAGADWFYWFRCLQYGGRCFRTHSTVPAAL